LEGACDHGPGHDVVVLALLPKSFFIAYVPRVRKSSLILASPVTCVLTQDNVAAGKAT
jgi:hypothetical protein